MTKVQIRGGASCPQRASPRSSWGRNTRRIDLPGRVEPLEQAALPEHYAVVKTSPGITREKLIDLLNEDLAREYQAVIAYTVYSQKIKGAAFGEIAKELEKHASEELSHAIAIARQIDYLGGDPCTTPKPVKTSDKAEDMLKFDLNNERDTIINYRQRIRQADALGEFALAEVLRKIIAEEQDHLIDLADALGIDPPRVDDRVD